MNPEDIIGRFAKSRHIIGLFDTRFDKGPGSLFRYEPGSVFLITDLRYKSNFARYVSIELLDKDFKTLYYELNIDFLYTMFEVID